MGSDKLFQRRKALKAKQLARRKATRRSKDRILIVCEGAKTEPYYFMALSSDLKLSSAQLRICGEECGSDPWSIAEYALEIFYDDMDFDRIYCVFDKNGHAKYEDAVFFIKKKRLPKKKAILSIKSVPCFEYWLLLHFRMTTKPYTTTGARSACECVIEELNRFMNGYTKGIQDAYLLTKNRLDTAIKHARLALSQAKDTMTDNPSTEIHMLVEDLRQLNKE